ncbi:MAG: UDP-N-acetylmuramoyl-tripeptide--D-alanyl-D-alanine ligase [Nitrospinales bacterium]
MNSDVQTVLKAINGSQVFGGPMDSFVGITINSRLAKPGELFFCIKGEAFDGHDFIDDAISKGVSGIIFSDKDKFSGKQVSSENLFAIQVQDTLRALQDLACFHRKQHTLRVVGVTGSNGKSTTKEMIAAIAETSGETLKNKGNLNNHIGLPLSLFELNKAHEIAVLEMGMSAAGEIRRLAEIALPEIGVITNIFPAHLVELKNTRAVQSAKGELFESLAKEGTAVVNADDPMVFELAEKLRSRVITFGIDQPADVTATDISFRKNTGFDFTVNLFGEKFPIYLPFISFGSIYNSLAAIATGHALGISKENISIGIGKSVHLSQRGEILTHNSMTILDDSYNANPGSMKDALKTMSLFHANGKKFFVIGDMLELGDFSETAHLDLGKEVASSSADYLITVGTLAKIVAQSARQSGIRKDRVASFESHQDAADFLSGHAASGDFILVKGSRSSRMEKIIEILTSSIAI